MCFPQINGDTDKIFKRIDDKQISFDFFFITCMSKI